MSFILLLLLLLSMLMIIMMMKMFLFVNIWQIKFVIFFFFTELAVGLF